MYTCSVGDRVKRILKILVVLLFIVPFSQINAQTLQEMYSKLAELEKQQSKVNSGKKLTSAQMANLQAEINSINASISNTESEISKANKDITDSEAKIKQKKEESNQMLLYLQLSNGQGNSMLEYVFQADNYTDFIYRYAVVSQMSDANNKLMDELNNLIKELNTKKADLAAKQEKLASQKQEQSTKLATLNANMTQLTEEGTSIADDIKSLKRDINRYEKMGCSKSEDVNSFAKKNLAVAGGWTLPVMSATVNSQFQVVRTDCIGCGGTSHKGIDLGVAVGTPVYAAAEGQVAYVVTSGSSLSCGGIKVYIYHNVGGKLYTTVYMHLTKALVSAGQQVGPNTVIATSGGTQSYDRCTTGAHLHFGVSNGNSVSSFNSNAFNPRQLAFLSGAANGVRVSR